MCLNQHVCPSQTVPRHSKVYSEREYRQIRFPTLGGGNVNSFPASASLSYVVSFRNLPAALVQKEIRRIKTASHSSGSNWQATLYFFPRKNNRTYFPAFVPRKFIRPFAISLFIFTFRYTHIPSTAKLSLDDPRKWDFGITGGICSKKKIIITR